eukprot:5413354-Pleurochrysis_carterae.AAC.1
MRTSRVQSIYMLESLAGVSPPDSKPVTSNVSVLETPRLSYPVIDEMGISGMDSSSGKIAFAK